MIGERAGFNETVTEIRTVGGIKTKIDYKKFELITTHTARRSFATNAHLEGLSSISIMKMTGHRSEKVFLKYISISQEQNATAIANHNFFNN